MSLILSNETTRASSEDAVVSVDVGRIDPRDDVCVRDDETRRRDPARALDAEPARVADHAHDAERSVTDAGGVEDGRVGWVDICSRAREGGERIDMRERVDQALGRKLLVERRQDRRVLGIAAELHLAGDVEKYCADGPAEHEAHDGTEYSAAHVVEHTQRTEHDQPPSKAPADHRPDRLTDGGEQHRPAESDQREPPRPDRRRQGRAEAGAEIGAEREAGKGEDADDEASPKPREGSEDDESEGNQIDGRHPPRFAGDRCTPARVSAWLYVVSPISKRCSRRIAYHTDTPQTAIMRPTAATGPSFASKTLRGRSTKLSATPSV